MELSKYIKSESVELNRSAIRFADYNPRKLSDESRKALKRGIKKFGLVGGIVVNKRTGLTVVSGHQRLSVMDELQKFPDNDYRIRVDVIDVDEQQALAMKYQIQAVPTLMLFKDGEVLGSVVAPGSKAAIEAFIRETLAQ